MPSPEWRNMKTTTNTLRPEDQFSHGETIISQDKLLTLFTADLCRAWSHKFCLEWTQQKQRWALSSQGCENPLSHGVKCSGKLWGTGCAQHRHPDPQPCPWQESLHQRHDPLTPPVPPGSHPNGASLEKWLGHSVGRSQELAGRWQVNINIMDNEVIYTFSSSVLPEVETAPAVTSAGKLRNDNTEPCLLLQTRQGTEDQDDGNSRFRLMPIQTIRISAVPICIAFSFLSFTQRSAQTPAPWEPSSRRFRDSFEREPCPLLCTTSLLQLAPFCNFKYMFGGKFQKKFPSILSTSYLVTDSLSVPQKP